MVTMKQDDIEALRVDYNKAVIDKAETFIHKHQEIMTSYAKHVLEYLDSDKNTGIATMSNEDISEIKEAIEYFETQGFKEDLTTDKKHYVEILLKHSKKLIK